MNKSLSAAIILSVLCFYHWSAAHAALGPLDNIDSRLIAESFTSDTNIGVDTKDPASQTLHGCSAARVFEVFDANVPGKILVAICEEDAFGPGNIEATFAKRIAEAKDMFKNMPAPLNQPILAGLEPITVSLEDGRQGKALTIPYVGHGIVVVPVAYVLTPKKDAVVMVQAYLNPNAPRNLNKEMAVLLQRIDRRIQQSTQ